MAVGDWGTGAYITLGTGVLPDITSGIANDAALHYQVVLASGKQVQDGGTGTSGPQPFEFSSTGAIPQGVVTLQDAINTGGMQLVAALAAYEGLSVHLSNGGVMAPDGTYTPPPGP